MLVACELANCEALELNPYPVQLQILLVIVPNLKFSPVLPNGKSYPWTGKVAENFGELKPNFYG